MASVRLRADLLQKPLASSGRPQMSSRPSLHGIATLKRFAATPGGRASFDPGRHSFTREPCRPCLSGYGAFKHAKNSETRCHRVERCKCVCCFPRSLLRTVEAWWGTLAKPPTSWPNARESTAPWASRAGKGGHSVCVLLSRRQSAERRDLSFGSRVLRASETGFDGNSADTAVLTGRGVLERSASSQFRPLAWHPARS